MKWTIEAKNMKLAIAITSVVSADFALSQAINF